MSCTCPERRGAAGALAALAVAALAMAALAPPARAETQVEPIAKLGVEGGYDSNVLFDGRSDESARISPDLGLKLRDHLWSFSGTYGADYLSYRQLQPNGVWNHRGALELAATPTERTSAAGFLRATYARDPVGLAQAGIFREGQQRALFLQGGGRGEYAVDPRWLAAVELIERVVRFQDATGGAMHAPSVELLRHLGERLLLGGAFASSVFQDFQPGGVQLAYAQGLRARARYQLSRFLLADAFAGPALWSGPEGRAIVPEAGAELRYSERGWDLRASAGHRLGLGSSATPGLVNSFEVGTRRSFGRIFDLRGDGGIWQTGDVPSGRNSTTGYSVAAEAGWHLTPDLRLAVGASHLARLDDSSSRLRRTTVGIRMGWELPVR